MNYLQSVYAYQYHARIKEGHAPSTSPFSANLILTCCLTMLTVSVLLTAYLLFPAVTDAADDFLRDVFGRGLGRTMGRLLGVLLILLIFPILKYTIGTDENYRKLIAKFKELSATEQASVAKKGNIFFITSLASIAIPMVIGMLT